MRLPFKKRNPVVWKNQGLPGIVYHKFIEK